MKFKQGMMRKTETPEVEIGNGLLSGISQKYKNVDNLTMDIVYVTEEKIAYNPLNRDVSKNDIEEMAQLIAMNHGLEQPLVLRDYTEKDGEEDFEYILLTGERRLRAIRLNKERGIMTDYQIPCYIKELDDIPLPLDDDLKEEFAIAVSNKYREKTDGDLYLESQRWRKIYKALKAAGESYIDYTDQEGNVIEQKNISGKRVRELVAAEMGISVGTEQKLEEVERKGAEEVKAALLAGKATLETAHALSKLEPEEQRKIVEQAEDVIEKKDVQKHVERKEKEIALTREAWNEDIRPIEEALDCGKVMLKESKMKQYEKAIQTLKKLIQ
ncbi:ParB N-terminal domain-containing protein [Roseburia hominis]